MAESSSSVAETVFTFWLVHFSQRIILQRPHFTLMSRDSCNEPNSSQSSVKETSHESTPSTTPITFSPSEPNVPPPSPMTKVSTPNEGERYSIGGGATRGVGPESKKKLLSSESFEGAYNTQSGAVSINLQAHFFFTSE